MTLAQSSFFLMCPRVARRGDEAPFVNRLYNSSMSLLSRRFFGWSLVLVVLGLITELRITAVNGLCDQGFFDKYAFFARQILEGSWPVHRMGDLSPGYLWSMVVAFGPCGRDYFGVRAMQIMAVSGVALLCGWTALRLWGRIAGFVAAMAVLSSRAALLNATDLEPETLILLLNTVALSLLVVGRSRWAQPLAGFFLGLSAICRPTALAVAGPILLVLWWQGGLSFRNPRTIVPAFPLGFAFLLVIPVLVLKILYSTIPGAGTLMNPGTVFFEGMNPLTTGLAGDAPDVVKAVENTIDEPDALHEAYRLVASRSLDGRGGESASNRYWWRKSSAFMVEEPATAIRILGRKALLALSSHDAWDLRTTVRKQEELDSPLWLPFGLVLSLALLGVVMCRGHRILPIFWVYTDVYFFVMLVFYVTSRQRNPVLPALAILGGGAVQHLVRMWREGERRRAIVSIACVIGATLLFGLDGRAQSEDQHTWKPLLAAKGGFSNADRFDEALEYMKNEQWFLASNILEKLDAAGYQPLRGAMTTSSVAYHRARCLLRLDRQAMLGDLLARASREALGDPHVLALQAGFERKEGRIGEAEDLERRLRLMHDRFTADFSIAQAQADFGDFPLSRQTLLTIVDELPEWSAPLDALYLISPPVDLEESS